MALSAIMAAQVATQTSPLTFTAITTVAEAESALDTIIDLIGSDQPAMSGLFLDKIDPVARLSLLAILTAYKTAM